MQANGCRFVFGLLGEMFGLANYGNPGKRRRNSKRVPRNGIPQTRTQVYCGLALLGLAVTVALGGHAAQVNDGSALSAATKNFTSLNGPGNVFLTASLIASPATANGAAPSVMVADFNGDGKPDFAVATEGCNTCGVSVFLGNGDGTFQAAKLTANLGGPHYVAAGDFNGDGKQDLAVIGFEPTNLNVPALFLLLGNGDGTFVLKTTLTGFSNPQSLVLGDFNGDTKLDVALIDQGNNSVSVFPGNGDGTFQAPVTTTGLGTGAANYGAAADFNKDGKLDLVIGDANSNHIVVLLGNGNGTFQAAHSFSFSTTQAGYDVAVGDFNGDGIPDVAATSPAAGTVNIFLGIGDGTFHTPTAFAAGQTGVGFPNNIAVGDFNKDGKLDVITSINGGSSVSVMLGKGDGTLSAPLLLAANQAPAQIAIADFNGDGNPDWIAGSTTGQFLTLALGNGNGTFQSGVNYATGAKPAVALGDFNNDGRLDLVTVNSGSANVSVLLGNGDGTFQPQMTTAVTGAFTGIAVGDLNGDGNEDVVMGDSSGLPPRNVFVLLGKGDGTFAAPATFPTGGSGEGWIVLADFNGDGKLDIAVVNQADNTVSILLGNGDGTFQAPKITGALASDGFLGAIAVADFNGDGKPDLAVPDYVGSASGQVAILLGKGDGTFQSPTFLTSHGGSTWPVAADFNKDGKIDLAVANQFGTIDVFLGNGNGTFNTPITLNDTQATAGCCVLNPIPISLTVGDFNLDGNLDLLVGDASSDNSVPGLGLANNNLGLQLFLGKGDGTFTGPQDYLAGAQSNPVLVGDFNGDGAPDVAAGDTGENLVSILLNQTPPPLNVSPKNLSFGNQLVGTSSPTQPITLKNNGGSTATITIGVSGDFTQTNNCASLTVASSCTVNVAFAPSTTGPRNGALTVSSNLPGGLQTVVLSGTGVAPAVTLSAASIPFGNQGVGTTSAPPQMVGLTNTGTATLTITSITITGADSGDFAQTNTCGGSVGAGGNCSINVTFKPSAAGARTASVSISDNAAGSPQTISLTGTGTAPTVMLAPASLSFSGQLVSTNSAAQNVTVTNNGTATLNITSIVLGGANSGDFSETNACGGSLAVGANCMIAVTFKPTATGNRTASVAITDDAAGSPQSILLTGTGTDFSIDAAPGASTSATVTPGNPAAYNLQVTPVSGFNGAVSLTCTGAPSESTCTVPSPVTPNGAASPFSANVTTTAPSLMVPLGLPRTLPPMLLLRLGTLLLTTLLAMILRARFSRVMAQRQFRFAYGLALIAFLAMATSLSGCGGGGGGGNHDPGTPAGTYTLTVTGTSNGVNHTRTLTLTVN